MSVSAHSNPLGSLVLQTILEYNNTAVPDALVEILKHSRVAGDSVDATKHLA